MVHFKQDPHIRTTDDPGPLVPGSALRLRWPEPYDEDVRSVRNRVQEEGRRLYVLRAPWGGAKCIVEAHYPDQLRARYADMALEPRRREDATMGRLVVVKFPPYAETIQIGDGGPGTFRILTPNGVTHSLLREIRRNNRDLNSRLKRKASAQYRATEIKNARQEDERETFNAWSERYLHAWKETRKHALPEKRKNFSMHPATR